jgi:hypothetical protein
MSSSYQSASKIILSQVSDKLVRFTEERLLTTITDRSTQITLENILFPIICNYSDHYELNDVDIGVLLLFIRSNYNEKGNCPDMVSSMFSSVWNAHPDYEMPTYTELLERLNIPQSVNN